MYQGRRLCLLQGKLLCDVSHPHMLDDLASFFGSDLDVCVAKPH